MFGCEVVWAIKDKSITHTFFDEGAATFFLPHLANQPTQQSVESATASGNDSSNDVIEVSPLRRTKYTVESHSGTGNVNRENTVAGMRMGTSGALGPDWHLELKMTGKAFDEVSIYLYNSITKLQVCVFLYCRSIVMSM